MKKGDSIQNEALREENEQLRAELAESREVLRAIHEGEVDALVVSGSSGERVYTLRSAEQPYRVLVEQMREGAVGLLADGTIHYANRAFAEMLKRPLEQVIGSTFENHVAEADRALFKVLLQQSLQGNSRGELNLLTGEGRLLPAYLNLGPLPLDHLSTVCVAVTDLSEQKRSEQILASERFARSILNQAADAIVVCDAQGQLTYINPAARRMAGLDPAGTNLEFAQEVWGRAYDYADNLIPIEEWSLSRALRGQVTTRECRMMRPDGSSYDVAISAVPLRDGDGRIVGAVATFTDITDRKATEQDLKAAKLSAERAKAAAEEASRAKDRFLAVLSHELRTPLTPVLAAVSMLQRDPRKANCENLDMIRRNVELEARLIDDMLDLTRVAQGKIELDRRPIALAAVIHRAVEVCRPEIDGRQLEFELDVGSVPYMVNADVARLQQVFWNLLRNAVKFTPRGGFVGIRCRAEGEQFVTVEVNDSGVGIAPESLVRIFEAFAQADRGITRQFGGLGLGLAISRSLVELHGGTIEAHSAGKNKGATFNVRLPLLAESTGSVPPGFRAPAEHRTDELCPQPPLRLLLVEDHDDTAQLLETFLTSEGHHIRRAGDVSTALKIAERETFDLLISDLGLPDASGFDLMRQLRARGHNLPGIALSGYGQEHDLRQSRQAGFVAHVVKPVDLDRLLTVLGDVAAQKG